MSVCQDDPKLENYQRHPLQALYGSGDLDQRKEDGHQPKIALSSKQFPPQPSLLLVRDQYACLKQFDKQPNLGRSHELSLQPGRSLCQYKCLTEVCRPWRICLREREPKPYIPTRAWTLYTLRSPVGRHSETCQTEFRILRFPIAQLLSLIHI